MNDYIQLSTLNDFIFCPYSIYLHNVYMETDEDMYKALPQTCGTIAHQSVDDKKYTSSKNVVMALPVYSSELGISGKIDVYKQDEHFLIERKNHLKHIFRGQIYQLWGQYFCMIEMGYRITHLAFYEISTNKMHDVPLPNVQDKQELIDLITRFKTYDPIRDAITINPNKCTHCIYCNLCDKTNTDNVYT